MVNHRARVQLHSINSISARRRWLARKLVNAWELHTPLLSYRFTLWTPGIIHVHCTCTCTLYMYSVHVHAIIHVIVIIHLHVHITLKQK